jgi:hypothetical protein
MTCSYNTAAQHSCCNSACGPDAPRALQLGGCNHFVLIVQFNMSCFAGLMPAPFSCPGQIFAHGATGRMANLGVLECSHHMGSVYTIYRPALLSADLTGLGWSRSAVTSMHACLLIGMLWCGCRMAGLPSSGQLVKDVCRLSARF